MAETNDSDAAAAGLAALSICESLLLALSDLKIISEKDASGVLEDAAAAHRGAVGAAQDLALNRKIADIIDKLGTRGKPMLRP